MSVSDPAFEPRTWTQEDFEVFRNAPDRWESLFTVKPGATPTKFVIGAIPPHEMARIESATENKFAERMWQCFLYGLRDIVDGPTKTEYDASGRTKEVVPKIKRSGVEYVDPEWLSKIFVRGLYEIGKSIGVLIYSWNQLTETESKN